MAEVDFYFDFGSPNAYLCHLVIPGAEWRTASKFIYKPILLGGVFKATGNVSPATLHAHVASKVAYTQVEMQRFMAKHGITRFVFNPHFPVNTLNLMRGAVAAQFEGVFEPYVEAIFHEMWEDPKKLYDPSEWHAAMHHSGLDADRIIARSQEPDVKARLVENTEQAIARGVFGAPTFFVGDEMYFGKYQLCDVEDALLSRAINTDA
jgi:2-hydroxychromene-2-carboxylate isomerase